VSAAAIGVIFGLAPVGVGLQPFLWGAIAWLRGASDEFDATAGADRPVRWQ
jgi:hypothetical protein